MLRRERFFGTTGGAKTGMPCWAIYRGDAANMRRGQAAGDRPGYACLNFRQKIYFPNHRKDTMQPLITSAKAAFIAGLTDRQINRMVDENIGPVELVQIQNSARLFAPLYAALARFYFETDAIFQSEARREVIKEFASRLSKSPRKKNWLSLRDLPVEEPWSPIVDALSVPIRPDQGESQSRIDLAEIAYLDESNNLFVIIEFKGYPVDLGPYIGRSVAKAKEVDQAEALVHASADILGGTPVFRGTRLPIENVLGELARGRTSDDVVAEYPDLTPAHVSAAQVYSVVNPRRGRPPRLHTLRPDLIPMTAKVLRPGRS